MVLLLYLMLKQVLNHKLKQFGIKQLNIWFLELYILIKWIKQEQISFIQ